MTARTLQVIGSSDFRQRRDLVGSQSIDLSSTTKQSPPLATSSDAAESPKNRSKDLKDTLKKQVKRNIQLFNDIKLTGSAPEYGPVLNCMRKQIAVSNRQKLLGEKARFYQRQ